MSAPDPRLMEGLRNRVAWSEDDVRIYRCSGADVVDWLERAFPSAVFLREGQLRQSLVLTERGRPVADVLFGRLEDGFIAVIDGLGQQACADHFERAKDGAAVQVEDLTADHRVVSLHGPYAWELLAHLYGEEMISLPYLNVYEIEAGWCLRAGKTGEFGYHLLLSAEDAERLAARLGQADPRYGLVQVFRPELQQAALENFFFDGLHEEDPDVTPLELQLRWRLRREPTYLGAEAIEARRRAGITQRLTALVSRSPLTAGDALRLDDRRVGTVFRSGWSELSQVGFASALVDLAWAEPWIDGFEAGGHPAVSVTPPRVRNRSLYVRPNVHSLLHDEQPDFPPLLAPWERAS